MQNINSGQCPACKTANPYNVAFCSFCSARLPWADAVQGKSATPPVAPVVAAPSGGFLSVSPVRIAGAAFLTIGALALIYYGVMFDTSVQVPTMSVLGQSFGGGRVNNMGLMQVRSNGLMLGGGAFALGVVLYALDHLKSR